MNCGYCSVLPVVMTLELALCENLIIMATYLCSPIYPINYFITSWSGARGSLVVKALGYKPEGRGPRPDEVKFT
jgi:hypothetical protein